MEHLRRRRRHGGKHRPGGWTQQLIQPPSRNRHGVPVLSTMSYGSAAIVTQPRTSKRRTSLEGEN